MPTELTVIVKDENGDLFEGADVTVSPGNFTGETNSDGEVTLSIEGESRYDVEVEAGDASQAVPFYRMNDQDSARLEVNLKYFSQLEKAEGNAQATQEASSSPWYQVTHEQAGYMLAGAVVLLAILVAIMRSRRKKRVKEAEKTEKKVTSKKVSKPKKSSGEKKK